MDQRTKKLMAMHHTSLTRDDTGRLYVSRKEVGKGLVNIEDYVDALIQGLKKCTKKKQNNNNNNDNNNNNRDWCSWYSHQRIGTMTGGLGNKRTWGDHPNYYIIENGLNTEKSPGDLKRLSVTKTQAKDHQLTLM